MSSHFSPCLCLFSLLLFQGGGAKFCSARSLFSQCKAQLKWARSVEEGVGGGVDPVHSVQQLVKVGQGCHRPKIDREALAVGSRAHEDQLLCLQRFLVCRLCCACGGGGGQGSGGGAVGVALVLHDDVGLRAKPC